MSQRPHPARDGVVGAAGPPIAPTYAVPMPALRHASLVTAFVITGCSGGSSGTQTEQTPQKTGASADASVRRGRRVLGKDASAPEAAPFADATTADASAPVDAAADSSDAPDSDDVLEGDSGLDAGENDCTTDAGHPVELRCTGLYSSWPSRTIAADVRAYAPGVTLWSDGAEKNRFVWLPPGTQIDTTKMDEWTFPVGTKFWKGFLLSGQPVETRFLWKRAAGSWFRTTYRWSADGASAVELTAGESRT